MKKILLALLVLYAAGLTYYSFSDSGRRIVDERRAEIVGGLADRYVASQTPVAEHSEGEVKTVSSLHHIPIQVDRFGDNIYRASGVGNSFLIETAEGNVLFDTGLATQGPKQKRLLQKAAGGPIRYIILSHSHADHLGATKFWQAEYPDAKIITHREFAEGQRYLKQLEHYFWDRNRLLYTFMPEHPPEPDNQFAYGGIKADITVADGQRHNFTLGGVEFEVIATPGAEGDDNIVLWLPQQAALFSGDFFGPLFPMVPNLFTLRGEKFRDPIKYIASLETLIELEPKMILPSHFDPIEGQQQILNDLTRSRDATRYIHDQTVAGMNAGKSVWELMKEIQLPAELALTQGHGKVSWDVRSIWEHYSTWFHFESTTELYPVPVREIYPDLAALIGDESRLLTLAKQRHAETSLEQALHLIEVVLAANPESQAALQLQLEVLQSMLDRAKRTGGNFSELGWLNAQIATTQAQL